MDSTAPNGTPANADVAENVSEMGDEADLEVMRKRIQEMEEEAEKLKQMQLEVDKQMQLPSTPGTPTFPTLEEKMDADLRSVYVGNVDYSATAQELENHFHGCGINPSCNDLMRQIYRTTQRFCLCGILGQRFGANRSALDDSLFKGRQIKVTEKRTNRPGVSSTDRPPRGGFRGFGRGRFLRGGGYMPYISSPYRGRSARPYFRGRGRSSFFYSPYLKRLISIEPVLFYGHSSLLIWTKPIQCFLSKACCIKKEMKGSQLKHCDVWTRRIIFLVKRANVFPSN